VIGPSAQVARVLDPVLLPAQGGRVDGKWILVAVSVPIEQGEVGAERRQEQPKEIRVGPQGLRNGSWTAARNSASGNGDRSG
jgi:hypothetical protein